MTSSRRVLPSYWMVHEGPPVPDGIEPEDWQTDPILRMMYDTFAHYGRMLPMLTPERLAEDVAAMTSSVTAPDDVMQSRFQTMVSVTLAEVMDTYSRKGVENPLRNADTVEATCWDIADILLTRMHHEFMLVPREFEQYRDEKR